MTGVFQIQAKDSVFRIGPALTAVSMIQNFSYDVNSNEERMEQLGDVNFVAITQTPEISSSFEIYSTGSLSQMLANLIYGINASTGEFEAPTGVSANTKLWRESDLERAVFDLVNCKKANESFVRSEVFTRLHLDSINIKADASGMASETYQAGGDLVEIFRGGKQDAYVVPCVRKTASPLTTITMPAPFATVTEGTTVDAGSAYKLYAIDVNGDRIQPSEVTIATSSADIVLTGGAISAGRSFPLGAKISIIVYRKTPNPFPTLTYATTARFVKADKIDIFLVDPAATYTLGGFTVTTEAHLTAGRDFNLIPYTLSDRVLRVQSVDMTVNMNRESLKQIAKNDRGNAIFYRAVTFPLDIQATVSMLERDLSEWEKITGKTSTDVLDLASFENKEWMLIIRYYLPSGTALQTVGLLNARVVSPKMNIAVKGRVENSFVFSGSKFAVQGT
jgi:hypothetical protein